MNHPLRLIVAATAASALLLAACSSGDTDAGTSSVDGSASTSSAGEGDRGRVVALGEEFLLADLLALGIEPVASTATLSEEGFLGIDPDLVEGIEALPSTDPNLEQLAALRPDTIVTSQFVVDEIGSDRLGALAEVVVIPDGLAADEQLAELGAALGLEDEAGALIDELDAAVAEAASAVPDDCEVAVVTVYPGPSPAAWVDGSSPVPAVVESLGCTLVPADAGDPDGNGRPFLSLEQIGLLNAPTIIALQSSSVAGEDEAFAEIEQSTLWEQLPAVEAGAVTRIDRLGFPGAAGQLRLLEELTAALG